MVGTVIPFVEERKVSGESTRIITEEPKRNDLLFSDLRDATGIQFQYRIGTPTTSQEDQEAWKFRGLSSLSVANSILIMIDSKCCRCDWDVHYSVRDSKSEALMLTAVEEFQCCSFGSLQNVVIRDLQKIAVARVCYKEKSCFTKKMMLAVYAPPDVLVGTVEEDTKLCFSSKTNFKIQNSDGHVVFYVEYQSPTISCCGCRPYFSVKSEDGKTEVAKILEKTKDGMRLQFNIKLGITSKILLTGFCLGLIHKPYNQKLDENED